MDIKEDFMDYDTICKHVGQLFLESRKQIDSMSMQIRNLSVENAELKKQLAELHSEFSKQRDNPK